MTRAFNVLPITPDGQDVISDKAHPSRIPCKSRN